MKTVNITFSIDVIKGEIPQLISLLSEGNEDKYAPLIPNAIVYRPISRDENGEPCGDCQAVIVTTLDRERVKVNFWRSVTKGVREFEADPPSAVELLDIAISNLSSKKGKISEAKAALKQLKAMV